MTIHPGLVVARLLEALSVPALIGIVTVVSNYVR